MWRLLAQFAERREGDYGASGQIRIVVHDHDAVGSRMDVELDAVGAGGERKREAGKGIFASLARHAAMGDMERTVRHVVTGGRDNAPGRPYTLTMPPIVRPTLRIA